MEIIETVTSEAPKPKVEKTSIKQYRDDERVFVLNRSNRPNSVGAPTAEFGDITLTVRNAEGDIVNVLIPKTTNPIELTAEADIADLKKSPRISDMIGKGVLKFIDEEEATKILQSPAGQAESARLQKWLRKDGGDESNKLNTGSPRGTQVEVENALTPEGSTLDIAYALIGNIQDGNIELTTGLQTLKGMLHIYQTEQLHALAANPGVKNEEIHGIIQEGIRGRR